MTNVLPISAGKPKRAYSNWLEAYIQHQRYSESPLNFHLWTGIFTIAAALQRKVWIDQLHFQWTPNMYIILVGPPGVAAKSTTMRQGISLLEHVEGVRFGPQSTTWQALLEIFAEAQTSIKIPGLENPQPMSCLSVGVGELGTFFNPEDKEFTDQLTAMWDGQLEKARRRTRKDGETIVANPWLNLIACTTPSWLQERLRKTAIGGGLTSRIVFVYGDKKRRYIAYPSELNIDQQYHEETKLLIHDLKRISELKGQYKLTPEAIKHGQEFYIQMHEGPLPEHLRSGRFDGYISRKQGHIHKLAIVLAAAKRDELFITLEDLQQAERYVARIEPDMARVFESIGVADSAQTTNEVEILIRNYRKIELKALWAQVYKTMDAMSFKNSIQSAVDAGIIKKELILGEAGNYLLTYLGGKKKDESKD
jgi:hypothetical protein